MNGSLSGTVLFIESNTTGTGWQFVLAARNLGLTPVLITSRPEKYTYLSRPEAPEVITVSNTDENTIADLILDRFPASLRGITSSSEYSISTAAALAARFGLPGPNPELVRSARSKYYQRQVLAAAGLPTPLFALAETAIQAIAFATDIGFPVIVKPIDGSGSVGVRACWNRAEVELHSRDLLDLLTPNNAILIESFIKGQEYSLELFSGQIVGITRKLLSKQPYFVEIGHDYPADLSPAIARNLAENVLLANKALGLDWGPVHWEVRIQQDKVFAIEVNPRLAGGFIPELIRLSQGIDLIAETMRLVVNKTPNLNPSCNGSAAIRFLLPGSPGRFDAVDGIEAARATHSVRSVEIYRSLGEELKLQGDFRDRIGHVIACAEHLGTASAAAGYAHRQIQIHIGPQSRCNDSAAYSRN